MTPNLLDFRISPEIAIALGVTTMMAPDKPIGQFSEMLSCRHPDPGEMAAHERVLGDAIAGDRTLFAREGYVEEAWRIVDPALNAGTPIYEYEPHTWGPAEAETRLKPAGGCTIRRRRRQRLKFRIRQRPGKTEVIERKSAN
jgi:glucose-6-phosphate 1-dehydrogenase